jgi:hypothetical protein
VRAIYRAGVFLEALALAALLVESTESNTVTDTR